MYITSIGGGTVAGTDTGGSVVVTGNPSGSNYPDFIGSSFWLDYQYYFTQEVNYLTQNNRVSGPTISLNTWTHVAMTFSGATIVGYINGAQYGSGGTPTATGISWKRIVVGGFNGDAQDAWLFNRVLTAAEVAHLYRQRHPRISRASLVGYWPLAVGGSATADYSGNGRTLTATGTVTDATRSAPVGWNMRTQMALRR